LYVAATHGAWQEEGVRGGEEVAEGVGTGGGRKREDPFNPTNDTN